MNDGRIRAAPGHSRLPMDRVLAAYNLALAAVWAAAWTSAPHAPWIALAHVTAAALPWLFSRVPEPRSRITDIVHELYPYVWLGAFWSELDLLRPVLDLTGIDGPVAALDRTLFGMHLHEVWAPAMPQLWFSELMYFSYFFYYALIVVPPLAALLQRRTDALRDLTFRLMVTYLACYVIFMVFPVDGPHFLYEHFQGPHTKGFFYGLVDVTQQAGDARGCSFPSSHVAAAVVIALSAWLWFPRCAAVVVTVGAVGVFLATTYTQNHYAIDAVAGVVYALVLQVTAVPWLRRWLDRATYGGPRRTGSPSAG
ncbi:MAG: phosphatase PAP2 family protein [Gemmatimonadota bacterium]|nr:phosphatase PAP2 family protein [Gemmatimonadota bacterium]